MQNTKLTRPATAPLKLGSVPTKRPTSASPMAARPIGRPSSSIARLRMASALDSYHSDAQSPSPSSPYQSAGDATSIASLKGEVLLVQRMLDTINESSFVAGGVFHDPPASDSEAVERLLIGIQPSQMSDSQMAEAKVMLLELLVERVKAVSVSALQACSSEHAAKIAPSRTSAFSNLVKFVLEIAERKRAWETRLGQLEGGVDGDDRNMLLFRQLSQKGKAASPPPSPRERSKVDPSVVAMVGKDPISVIDLALNEPTVSEIHKLIEEQKALQGYLRKLLKQVDNSSTTNTANGCDTPPRSRAGSMHPANRAIAAQALAAADTASNVSLDGTASRLSLRPGSAAKRKAALQQDAALRQKQQELSVMKERLDALEKENGALRSALEANEATHAQYVKQESLAKEQRENERELRCRVEAAAYGNLQRPLMEMGVLPSTEFLKLSEVESAAVVQRMNQLFFEGVEYCADMQGTAKGRKALRSLTEAEPPAVTPRGSPLLLSKQEALDAVGWVALHHQNTIIAALIDRLKEVEAGGNNAAGRRDEEIGRLHRVIKTLETRVFALKAENTKQNQRLTSQLQSMKQENEQLVKRLGAIHDEAPKHTRIVNTKNQPMTSEEREKALYAVIADKEKNIASLTQILKQLQNSIEEEQAAAASLSREQRSLLDKCRTEVEKVNSLQQQLAEAKKESDMLRDGEALAKRDVREKTVLETDATQRLWKLKVEMHISQNIVAELRKREQKLLDQVEDSAAQKEFLRGQIDELTEENQQLKTAHAVALGNARAEVAAAKNSLQQERQRALAMERDLERLQVVDIQLETLEGNFNNYAASMIVRREAGEEEDRTLGECLKQLQGDVFALPGKHATEDEVAMVLRKLRHKKEVLEGEVRAEEHSNALSSKQKKVWAADGRNAKSPNIHDDHAEVILEGATNKKQLGTFLQERLVEIQTFACERMLNEIRRERMLRTKETELHLTEEAHDAAVKDVTMTKSQMDSLVHRTSELELERKQLLKDRSDAEATIKKQQKIIQKLQLTNEEQDHMLVDVGTKLQKRAIDATAPKRPASRSATSQLLNGVGGATSGPNAASQDDELAAAGTIAIKPLSAVYS